MEAQIEEGGREVQYIATIMVHTDRDNTETQSQELKQEFLR